MYVTTNRKELLTKQQHTDVQNGYKRFSVGVGKLRIWTGNKTLFFNISINSWVNRGLCALQRIKFQLTLEWLSFGKIELIQSLVLTR